MSQRSAEPSAGQTSPGTASVSVNGPPFPEPPPIFEREEAVPEPVESPVTTEIAATVEPLRQPAEPRPVQPPVEAPPDSGPFEVHEVDRPPVSAPNQSPLETTTTGLSARQGSVRMKVLVGADGGIDAVRMLDEITDSDLNQAAIGAILHWRFIAGSHRGAPVSVWVPVRLEFSLAQNRMRSSVTVTR